MKPLNFSLRVWFAATGLLSFLGGWAILSHSGKPAALFASFQSTTTPDPVVESVPLLPTLQPVPSIDSLTQSGSLQAVSPAQSAPSLNLNSNSSTGVYSSAPRLRTRGS